MFLSIDIGNTNITLGVFDGEKLVSNLRLPSKEGFDLSLLKDFQIDSCAIASVVDGLGEAMKLACDNAFGIDSFLFDTKFSPIKIGLNNPDEVGADRIANAYGAYCKYKLPVIVVDSGTATTFDIVSSNGVFLGGVIMPGLNLQLKSLNSNTSKLPKIEASEADRAIGNSTVNAILSGVIRGSASAIEGLIHQCELELGEKATVVATGGYSGLISKYMFRRFDDVNPNLTLEGLKKLYEFSHVNKS